GSRARAPASRGSAEPAREGATARTPEGATRRYVGLGRRLSVERGIGAGELRRRVRHPASLPCVVTSPAAISFFIAGSIVVGFVPRGAEICSPRWSGLVRT